MQLEEFRCGISKGTIFSLCTKASHNRLFLASPRDQRGAKEKAITSSGSAIGRIPCPIGIRVGFQNKWRLGREVETEEKSALKLSKDAQDSSIVSQSWNKHKLAHLMNYISDVWSSDCEIDMAANQLPIKSRIRQ